LGIEKFSKLFQNINQLHPAHTKYESSNEHQEITLIEVESVKHRDAVKDEFFLELFKEELYWIIRKQFLMESKTVSDIVATQESINGVWENSLLHDHSPPFWLDLAKS